MVVLNLNECDLEVYKYSDGLQMVYYLSHSLYFLACEDEVIGHLYKDYEKPLVVFEIYYN